MILLDDFKVKVEVKTEEIAEDTPQNLDVDEPSRDDYDDGEEAVDDLPAGKFSDPFMQGFRTFRVHFTRFKIYWFENTQITNIRLG